MSLQTKLTLWLESIQTGFILILPIVILGSLALTLLQIPQLFSGYLNHSFLLQLANWLLDASYGAMALILAISISHDLSSKYKEQFNLPYFSVTITTITLVCLLGILKLDYGQDLISNLGVTSIAKAIICAIASTELCIFFYNNRISQFKFLQHEINENMQFAIRAVFPAICVPFIILGSYSYFFLELKILPQIIPFFIGDVSLTSGFTYLQTCCLILINQLVWFVGIHPSSLIEISKDVIFTNDTSATYSRQFLDIYAHLGGAGATLGLIIAMLFSKKGHHKRIAQYSILPGIFNINELLIFGIPIVFNRYLLLPFILAPIITTSLARIFFELNLISLDPSQTSWNTPVLISGYLSSGGFSGILLQILSITVSALIYWPFVKRYDQVLIKKERLAVKSMITELCKPDVNFKKIMTQQTKIGHFCRTLKQDLNEQLGDSHFAMYYQPKINTNCNINGAEALVRWHHPQFGNLPPCIFVSIAETSDQINRLGRWINERCMQDIKLFREAGMSDLQVAINVSPKQLLDHSFFDDFLSIIDEYQIPHSQIELEITESQKLHLTDKILDGIEHLSQSGISIAVDDFGMGYTSLRYLKSFKVDTIKLDGSMVCDVTKSNIVQEIIRSLSALTESMNSKLVAEWVEDEAQFNELIKLGCNQFQGAYFSMPVTKDILIKQYENHTFQTQ